MDQMLVQVRESDMRDLTRQMLHVIRDGRRWTQRTHYDCVHSGAFVVEEDGLRLGQLRLYFKCKGTSNPYFMLLRLPHAGWYRTAGEFELPMMRSIDRGQPGYALVLRALSQRIFKLQQPMVLDQNTAKGREPAWYAYLTHHR